MGCPCYFGFSSRSNRVVWGVICIFLALGVSLVVSGSISGHDCLQQYEDCVKNTDNNESQCQAIVNQQCGLEVFQSLIASGIIVLLFLLPLLCSYFCCCSQPPAQPDIDDLDGPYQIVVLQPNTMPVMPPAARDMFPADWQRFQAMHSAAADPHAASLKQQQLQHCLISPTASWERAYQEPRLTPAPVPAAAAADANADAYSIKAVKDAQQCQQPDADALRRAQQATMGVVSVALTSQASVARTPQQQQVSQQQGSKGEQAAEHKD